MINFDEHSMSGKNVLKKCPKTYDAQNIYNIPLAADMQRAPSLDRHSEHTEIVYNIKKHGI